ncbi:MarR family transcriptional regulator [Ensifer sp. LC163]|uniref:MarR family transcriptional regulator n=1 Tax=Ensifer sp. LC163 TaxID=1120652 RepID=UPI001FCDFB45|nr:MarR family transcriptional regulator [Ensifer sp. LC163]
MSERLRVTEMIVKTTPTSFDARWQSITFSSLAMSEIMDNPVEGETPQARLKQLGMLSLLYNLHLANIPLTLTNITERTGLTRGGAAEPIDQLVARGLLREGWAKNALGRGKAREFEISDTLFARLKQATSP